LTFLLGMAFQLLHARFLAELNAEGYTDLRPVHGMVFQALRGPGATSTELAEQLGVTKQAAGQIVQYLEEHGYVERTDHPDGGRRRLVVLTEKAHKHLSAAGRVLHGLEADLADRLQETDLGGMRRELARLIRALAGDTLPPLRPLW
jgi:DNA-binding MarR family transcriptional regulator